jgi:RHS repeat-associated protein
VRGTIDTLGRPTSAQSYDAWGTPVRGLAFDSDSDEHGESHFDGDSDRASLTQLFGFDGERQDPHTGLVNLRARWYQPGSSRMLGRDPFAGYATQPLTQHPYVFGRDNPLRYADPSGRSPAMLNGADGSYSTDGLSFYTNPSISSPTYNATTQTHHEPVQLPRNNNATNPDRSYTLHKDSQDAGQSIASFKSIYDGQPIPPRDPADLVPHRYAVLLPSEPCRKVVIPGNPSGLRMAAPACDPGEFAFTLGSSDPTAYDLPAPVRFVLRVLGESRQECLDAGAALALAASQGPDALLDQLKRSDPGCRNQKARATLIYYGPSGEQLAIEGADVNFDQSSQQLAAALEGALGDAGGTRPAGVGTPSNQSVRKAINAFDESGATAEPAAAAASAEPAAAARGNIFHYDRLNGGAGEYGPTQLQRRYPETQFRFARRGEPRADVEYVGGRHPSKYPGSDWPEGFDFGDFKPDTTSGSRTFYEELNSGKLPQDTVPLPYDPANMTLKTEYYFGP